MNAVSKTKQLWIGLVEVRALHRSNDILEDTKGAFVNIVTWAANADQYRQNAELITSKLGLFVAGIENAEPIKARRKKSRAFNEEIEDMVSRAEGNPNAIIYGTFHTFEKDDA